MSRRQQAKADQGLALPCEEPMESAVAGRLRRLRAKGKAEKVGDGWRRKGVAA